MKDWNFINIQSFMVEKLKLSWNELVIYALIYWFSQDWKSKFRGALSYIEDWLKISRNSVILNIGKLVDKGYIKKELDTTWNLYSADIEVVQKLNTTSAETELVSSAETEHNIYNTNNKNNNITTVVDKKSSIEKIYKTYKDWVDIESKYLYPAVTKVYLNQLLNEYTEAQLISSIDNYFTETEKKWRKSPKYFFSNSKRSDNYRIFEWFIKDTWPKKEIKIEDLFF